MLEHGIKKKKKKEKDPPIKDIDFFSFVLTVEDDINQ